MTHPSAHLNCQRHRLLGCLCALVVWLGCGLATNAAEVRRRTYTVPAGEAPEALSKFAEQSGEQVVYLLNQVKGVRTNAVHGRFSAREAVERLIANTALRVVEDKQTGAFLIQRGSDAALPEAGAPAQKPKPAEKSGAMR
jgi:iron complex outermembrane recepter protein